MRVSIVFAFLFCPTLLIGAFDEARAAEVELFTPQGSVKLVRQVRVKFSTPMIAFGDPRSRANPFEINCPESYATRWVDSRNWVLDFNRDVPTGVSCTFTLPIGAKDQAGVELRGTREFKFSTGGPSVLNTTPATYQDIESDQAFILELDGKIDESSVEQGSFFSSSGVQESIPIRVLRGADRDEILKSHYSYKNASPEKLAQVIIVQPLRAFPESADVTFHWTKDVRSSDGAPVSENQTYTFKVRPPFQARLTCGRDNADAGCNPILPITLAFTAPVPIDQAAKIQLSGPLGKSWKPKEFMAKREEDADPTVTSVSFDGPFPERNELTVVIPKNLRDESARALSNSSEFPLKIRMDSYSPLAKFAADFGILELRAMPQLPLSLRSIETTVAAEGLSLEGKSLSISKLQDASKIIEWLNRVSEKASDWSRREQPLLTTAVAPASATKQFSIQKPAGARDFELVGIPLKTPGLHIVEIASPLLGQALLGKNRTMYVASAALVTDLSVHLKWARENTLVWVTELSTGKPAAGAKVSVRGCDGREYANGLTDASGIAVFKSVPARGGAANCDENRFSSGLIAFAQRGDDLSFVYSGWDEGIEPWRFSISNFKYSSAPWGGALAHTIFDRMLYRAGEPVQMKHVLRDHKMQGFAQVPAAKRPKKIVVRHLGSGQKQEFPLKWSPTGTAETVWPLPKEAKLGTYQVSFSQDPIARQDDSGDAFDAGDWQNLAGGRFRVEEFRVPLMKAVVKLPSESLIRPSRVPVDVSVQYLAGGGARNAPVRLRSQVTDDHGLRLESHEGFEFSNGETKEKRAGSERSDSETKESPMISRDLKLDDTGSLRAQVDQLPTIDKPKILTTELEYTDPSGEVQSVSARTRLLPAHHLIGIKTEGWLISSQKIQIATVVVDSAEKPVPNAQVEIEAFRRIYYTHRKKLVGGFYAYDNTEEIRKIGSLCRGTTDSKGLFSCEASAPATGSIILQAKTTDSQGFADFASRSISVSSPEEVEWSPQGESDRVDLIPETRRYEPGETARLQLKSPFQNATVLVTVEREGIIDRFVQALSHEKPFIDVPIKGSYAPNVYVSALAVRGRIGDPKPTALLDLGKPAYKMGLTEIKVGWRAHELNVRITPEKSVYKVREKAKVRVQVTRVDGKPLPIGSEIALAAVDEGLLQLQPNTSWNLLEAMMGSRGLEVASSTAQSFVIGKRHFGLKARPPGGDGGSRTSRELFDTLLLWKPKILLDAKGEATVEIPLNDSITSFAIAAVAQGGWDFFGSGRAKIQSTKDLMIFSGAAPVAREGDKIESVFTIRNTTDRAMQVQTSVEIKGAPDGSPSSSMELAPGESKVLRVPVQIPVGSRNIEYTVRATETQGASDSLRVKTKVATLVTERIYQSTISQVEKDFRMPVEVPAGAIKGRGGIGITAQAKLGRGLEGIRKYMSDYPYTCMEQMLSRAVALEDEALAEKVLSLMPNYLDADGFLKYFPGAFSGSDTLTAYAVSLADEAGLKIPPDTAEKMREALKRFAQGQLTRDVPLGSGTEIATRKLAALEALSRSPKTHSEVIDADLIRSIEITPNAWPTSALLDWIQILRRSPQLPNQSEHLKTAQQILRARLNFQGSTMGFSTEARDRVSWLMTSIDTNAVRTILATVEDPSWREDMPRIVRGALLRQKRGHWDLTTANAWGTLALKKFSSLFENTPVTGELTVSLGGRRESVIWKTTPQGKSVVIPWPTAGKDPLSVHQVGSGRPWVTVQSIAAVPLKAPLSSGYRIRRLIEPVEQKNKGRWTAGDVLRVRLDIDAQADQSWVVVSDPIPAGATILGSGLGGDSAMLNKSSGTEQSWASYQERGFETFRSYHPFVTKGKLALEYTMRLNSAGKLNLPPTRVEAMYAPEMFGELPNASLDIGL